MQRVALITGGEGGLARAIQTQLLKDKWEVHAPGKATLDVTSSESIDRAFQSLPRLDFLIHTAGIIRDQTFSRMEESDWDDVLTVNLHSAFHVARRAHQAHMHAQQSGHILFIGSGAARFGAAGQANYAAAKAGLVGLMQSLAQEYGESNVRVNAILPGFLRTKMTAGLDRSLEDHALQNLNTPEESARFVSFLDTMPHTSGQVFQLDSRIGREL
ncbi:MAG: SDR family NAD(P)-dependent oxidoreductase [Chthoniobacterales bacterium]